MIAPTVAEMLRDCREAAEAYLAAKAVVEQHRSRVRTLEAAPRHGNVYWEQRLDAAREALDAAETARLEARKRGLLICSAADVAVQGESGAGARDERAA